MILGMVGEMGSGKTLMMTFLLYLDFTKGRKIYANYHLKFDYELLSLKQLLQDVTDKKQVKNVCLAIDEIHIFFDSRKAMSKKNILGSYLVTQSRKKTMDILYTTQYYYQVDKRVRDNTDYLIRCNKIDTDLFEYTLLKHSSGSLLEGGSFEKVRTFIIKPSEVRRVYQLYDTEEIMMDFGET